MAIDGSVKIGYPQFSGMQDIDRQRRLNSLVRSTIWADTVTRSEMLYDRNEIGYDLSYRVALNTTNVISIVYEGVAQIKNAAFPTRVVLGNTFDLRGVKQLALSDVVTIDDKQVGRIISASDVRYTDGSRISPVDWSNLVGASGRQELRLALDGGDSSFYLEPHALLICVPIIHAAGDYAIVALPHDYLSE